MLLEGAKVFLKGYSLVIVLILAIRMLSLVDTKRSVEGTLTIAALIPIILYLANI